MVATGCYVTAQGGVACDLPGVDYAVDNDRKSGIFDLVAAHLAGEVADPAALPADPFGYRPGAQPLHTRATIKIQDGCDNFCTFCIIPAVRGRAQSRSADDILDEARRLLDEGHRELVLTGVNIGRYRLGRVELQPPAGGDARPARRLPGARLLAGTGSRSMTASSS